MMLLDTCALLWLANNQNALSKKVKQLVNAQEKIYVSAVSALEIGIKVAKKKLQLPCTSSEWFFQALEFHNLTEIPITSSIALTSAQLPPLHNDPSDRLIIATAIEHNLTILTPDQHISQYREIRCEW